MIFYSFSFIAVFLPLVVFGFFLCNKYLSIQASKVFLTLASFFFYAYWNPIYLPLMLCSILFNHIISNKIRANKSKALLWAGVSLNFMALGYFKYMDFFIENINTLLLTDLPLLKIALPLGISFFTFQQVAYLVDSYKDKTDKHSLLDYSLFVSFFPQLIAGPIVHWREMMPQFSDNKQQRFNADNFLKGMNIFILGFLKKVIIADNLAILTNEIFRDTSSIDMVSSWYGGICFMFQIYFDFSAYSEMAIGAALMMNIKLPINFNSPYKARNINEFWNKWHMTLTRWFFQYTFLPLAAIWSKNNNGKPGMSLNVLIRTTLLIFILSGVWHGAEWTFIIWGFMHGIALVTYRIWQTSKKSMPIYLSKTFTFIFLICAAVVFRCENLESLGEYSFAMIGREGVLNGGNIVSDNLFILSLALMIPAYIIYSMPNVLEIVGYEQIKKKERAYYIAPFLKVNTKFLRMENNIIISIVYATLFSFVLINVMTADSPDAFIYFDF